MSAIQRHAYIITYFIINDNWWKANAPNVIGKTEIELIRNRIDYYFNHEEGWLLRTQPNYCRVLYKNIMTLVAPAFT
jgi:hypothetical protein